MSHIFDEKIAELTTELDRLRAVNARLLEDRSKDLKLLRQLQETIVAFDPLLKTSPSTTVEDGLFKLVMGNKLIAQIRSSRGAIAAAEEGE